MKESRRIRLLIISFILIPTAFADMGIFNTLDGLYADSVYDLPEATDTRPDMVITPSDQWFNEYCTGDTTNNCVYGWLDIVGFRNAVKIGDEYYINEPANDAAIIQYKTYVRINGRYLFREWNYHTHEAQNDGVLTTVLTATAVLYQIHQGGYVSYANETRIFYDSEPAPRMYGKTQTPTVLITEYNNTISPKVNIKIDVSVQNASKTTIKYGNTTATHYFNIGVIRYTDKNVPYLEVVRADYWAMGGNELYRLGNNVLVNGSRLNYSRLNISISTPYSTTYSNNFSIETVDYTPEKTWNPVFFGVLGTIGILGWGTSKFMRNI